MHASQDMQEAMGHFAVAKFKQGFAPGKVMQLLVATGVCGDFAQAETVVWWHWDWWCHMVR